MIGSLKSYRVHMSNIKCVQFSQFKRTNLIGQFKEKVLYLTLQPKSWDDPSLFFVVAVDEAGMIGMPRLPS